MRRSLAHRVDRLEGGAKPPAVAVPNVLHVRIGETIDEAVQRFDAQYPRRARHHSLLIVPARDRVEDEADFDAKFLAHQTKLIADAKAETRKVTNP